MDLLFKVGAAYEKYKRPKNTYDFKNKILAAMKVQYERITGPGTHSCSDNPGYQEDVCQLLSGSILSIKRLWTFKRHCDATIYVQEKENVNNASQLLAPHPQPLPRSADISRNPLSSLTNEVPLLVTDISPKPTGTKKQRLMSYDTNNIMVSFAAINKEIEVAFQDLMRTKMEVENDKAASEKHRYLMFLIEKKASGVITDEEFELFKNM
jgi:hypothetical protein